MNRTLRPLLELYGVHRDLMVNKVEVHRKIQWLRQIPGFARARSSRGHSHTPAGAPQHLERYREGQT